MILLYLFVQGIRGFVWCLGWLVWGCLAFAGLALVALAALICLPLHCGGRAWREGIASLRPPRYLRKSRT